MAISHETVTYDVHDARVYALLTDSAAASPTYGSGIDVPGIQKVDISPNMVTSELHGDARIIARRGRTDRFKIAATYAKIQVDVLAVLMGGIVSDITGPPTETRWDLTGPAPLPFFRFEFKVDDVDLGLATVIMKLNKCQLTGGTLFGQQSNTFGTPDFSAEAYQPDFAATPMGTVRVMGAAQALD